MAEVILNIGGHAHSVVCRDGEEPHLLKLSSIVDSKVREARAAVGGIGDVRQLLLASLLLADELLDAQAAQFTPAAIVDASDDAELLENLATHIEALAARVEKAG